MSGDGNMVIRASLEAILEPDEAQAFVDRLVAMGLKPRMEMLDSGNVYVTLNHDADEAEDE